MKRYRIAQLNIDMTCSGRTAAQAEAYASACVGAPDITIHVDGAAVLAAHPELQTADMAEYLASGECFAVGLLAHQGVMLHASAVELDGRCVCFSAPPGVGKSTMTCRWERIFGARVLNDDKPALRCLNGVWYAFGTPWCGKDGINVNMSAPLAGICFLHRGDTLLRRLTTLEAVPQFLKQTAGRGRVENAQLLMRHLDHLLRNVPVFEFYNHAAPGDEQITYRAMRDAMGRKDKAL